MASNNFECLMNTKPIFAVNRVAETGRLTLKATINFPPTEQPYGPMNLLDLLNGCVQGCFGTDVRVHVECDPDILGSQPPFAIVELECDNDAAGEFAKARLKAIARLVHISAVALIAWDMSFLESDEIISSLESILTKHDDNGARKLQSKADEEGIPTPMADQTPIGESEDNIELPSALGEPNEHHEYHPMLKRIKTEHSD